MLINKNDKGGSLFQISAPSSTPWLVYYDSNEHKWWGYKLHDDFKRQEIGEKWNEKIMTKWITDMLINDYNERLYNFKDNSVPVYGIILDKRTLKYSPYHNKIYRFTKIGKKDRLEGKYQNAKFILYVAKTFTTFTDNNGKNLYDYEIVINNEIFNLQSDRQKKIGRAHV